MRDTVLYSNGVDPDDHWRPTPADRARYARRRREMQPAIESIVVHRATKIRRDVAELFWTGDERQTVIWADAILARRLEAVS